ncbi:hypothetical protein Lal_00042702 [Lupinus albus]|nr:hypothetical protein Lal_00042702 [Lupinus albus]
MDFVLHNWETEEIDFTSSENSIETGFGGIAWPNSLVALIQRASLGDRTNSVLDSTLLVSKHLYGIQYRNGEFVSMLLYLFFSTCNHD